MALDRYRRIFEEILAPAGIAIDGPNPWDIRVHDNRFYARVLARPSLGLGESYMEGWWDCQAIDQLFHRAMLAQLHAKLLPHLSTAVSWLTARLFNPQSRRRALEAAHRHYNLPADVFMSFLDPYNQYTCAYFKDTTDLNEAQVKKLELICRKLDLKKTDRVLDIGSGWGGFSKFASERHGCSVTGISISDGQLAYAREYCRGLSVDLVKLDYRDLPGSFERFDKVLVCGMIEHVGHRNYRRFAKIVRSVLKDSGVFLLHTIGGNKPWSATDPWFHEYIFPNSNIPSLSKLSEAFEGLFSIEDVHNFGPHYDPTLMAWYGNFQAAWPRLKLKYDERFRRMWEYYFLSCAGLFRSRENQLWQIVMTPIGRQQPDCRLS